MTLSTGSNLSSPVTLNSYAWFTLEVPDADKTKAVTIQTISGITGDWEDVIVLTDVTNKYKGLTATEMAVVGPLEVIRLKFASNVAAASQAILHATS